MPAELLLLIRRVYIMEKSNYSKIIVFIIIALIPVMAVTIIPKLLFGMYRNEIDTMEDNGFYTASIVVALILIICILAVTAYMVFKPYIICGIAYFCGILYSIFMSLKPGDYFNSLNFYIVTISYAVNLVVLIALMMKEKKEQK